MAYIKEYASGRKIEDTYGKNPMKVLSNEETNDFNKQNRRRVEARWSRRKCPKIKSNTIRKRNNNRITNRDKERRRI